MEIGWIDTPEEWRDVFIMAFMVAGILLSLITALFVGLIGWAAFRAVNKTRSILKTNLQPTLENVRETSESVRGTVAFISDYAVRPVVRVYSTYAGARRFVATFARLVRHKRGG